MASDGKGNASPAEEILQDSMADSGHPKSKTQAETVLCGIHRVTKSSPFQLKESLSAGTYQVRVENMDTVPRVFDPLAWSLTLARQESEVIQSRKEEFIGNRVNQVLKGATRQPVACCLFEVSTKDEPVTACVKVRTRVLIGGIQAEVSIHRLPPPSSKPDHESPESSEFCQSTSVLKSDPNLHIQTESSNLSLKQRKSSARQRKLTQEESVTPIGQGTGTGDSLAELPSDPASPQSKSPVAASTSFLEEDTVWSAKGLRLERSKVLKLSVPALTSGLYRISTKPSGQGRLLPLTDISCRLKLVDSKDQTKCFNQLYVGSAIRWTYVFRVSQRGISSTDCELLFKNCSPFQSIMFDAVVSRLPDCAESIIHPDEEEMSDFQKMLFAILVIGALCILKIILDVLSIPLVTIPIVPSFNVILVIRLYMIVLTFVSTWLYLNSEDALVELKKRRKAFLKMRAEMKSMKKLKGLKRGLAKKTRVVDKLKTLRSTLIEMTDMDNDINATDSGDEEDHS